MKRHLYEPNDLIKIASYWVLEEYEKKTGESPTGLYFNKILSILNKELNEEGIPFPLSHCWYRWGDEVVRSQMPKNIRWLHEHEDPPRTTLKWENDEPEIPQGDKTLEHTHQKIGTLTETYYPRDKIRDLVNYVYSYAPFPFQDSYRNLRNAFIDLHGEWTPIEGLNRIFIQTSFRSAIAVFPHSDFSEFSLKVPPFKTVMEALLSLEEETFPLVRELSESFWFAFCYYLRIHPRANQKVDRSMIEYWKGDIPSHIRHYDNSFNSLLLESADKYSTILEDDNVALLVREAEKIQSGDLEFIRSFDDDFVGLNTFLNTVRRLASR